MLYTIQSYDLHLSNVCVCMSVCAHTHAFIHITSCILQELKNAERMVYSCICLIVFEI